MSARAGSRDGSGLEPTLLLMTGRMLAFAATFFVPAILARVFSQAEFGTYKQLFLVFATLNAAAQFGIAESLFYFVPIAPRSAGRHVANSVLFLTASGLACLVPLTIARRTLAHWINNAALGAYLPGLGLFLLFMLATSVLEIVMIAQGRYLLAAATYGASDVLRAAFFVVPVLLDPRIESLLLGAVAFAAIRAAAALAYLCRGFRHEFRPSAGLFKSQVAYAAPFAAACFLDILQWQLPQYAVSYHFDAATFAVYAVGCLQIPLVDFLSSSASNVMMVRMGEAIRENRPTRVLDIWHETGRQLALILFPLVGLLLVIAHPLIVLLFTERYSASVPIFMIISTTILLLVLMTDSVLRVHADTRFIFFRNGVRTLVVALLISAFVSRLGLPGAVLVTVLATLVGRALDLARIRTLLGVALSDLIPWRALSAILGVTAGAAVVARGLATQVALPPLLAIGVTSILYAGAYVALLLEFGLLTAGEKQAVVRRLRLWRRRLDRRGVFAPSARRLPPTG